MDHREYRGFALACHPEGLWSYRAQAWEMWSEPMTLAECKAAIDAELASYSTASHEADAEGTDRTVEG